MRVLMITTRFPPDYGGGARQAQSLAKKLMQRGVQVEVVTRRLTPWVHYGPGGSLKVHRLSPTPHSKMAGIRYRLKLFWWLLCHSRKFDVFHVHNIHINSLLAIIVGKLSHTPVVVKMTKVGTDDPIAIRKRFMGRLQVKITGMADAIISTSSELTELYLRSGLRRELLVEIPNGVNLDEFKPVEDKSLGTQSDLRVLFCGMVSRRKGVDMLMEAWIEVQRKFEKAKLTIVGPKDERDQIGFNGSLYRELKALVKTKGLNVEFTGLVDEVKEYYRSSGIFVLPTKREGLPNSLLEAMASGLPCVAGNIQCIRDAIRDGYNGLLIPPGDPQALASALLRLLTFDSLRRKLGTAARQTVEAKFNLDMIADRYVALYKRLLER